MADLKNRVLYRRVSLLFFCSSFLYSVASSSESTESDRKAFHPRPTNLSRICALIGARIPSIVMLSQSVPFLPIHLGSELETAGKMGTVSVFIVQHSRDSTANRGLASIPSLLPSTIMRITLFVRPVVTVEKAGGEREFFSQRSPGGWTSLPSGWPFLQRQR